jgi:hypothetical protein
MCIYHTFGIMSQQKIPLNIFVHRNFHPWWMAVWQLHIPDIELCQDATEYAHFNFFNLSFLHIRSKSQTVVEFYSS